MVLNSGGASGGSDTTSDDESAQSQEADEDAMAQLEEADQGSGSTSSSSSGSMDVGGGLTSGGGDTTTGSGGSGGSGGSVGPREQADQQLTRTDPGSGGGQDSGRSTGGDVGTGVTSGGGDTTRTPPSGGDAGRAASSRQTTNLDPAGMGGGAGVGVTSGDRETTRRADAVTADERRRQRDVEAVEREIAEQQVDATIEEGIEGDAGSGRDQQLAQEFEQRIIEEDDRVNTAEDIAIVRRDGRLVAVLTRNAQVEAATEDLDLDSQVLGGLRADQRPAGKGLDPGEAVSPSRASIEEEYLDFDFEDGSLDVSLKSGAQQNMARERDSGVTDVEASTEGVDPGPTAQAIEDVGEFAREQSPRLDAGLTVFGASLRTRPGANVKGVPLPGEEDVDAAIEGLDPAAEFIDEKADAAISGIGTPGRVFAEEVTEQTGFRGVEVAQSGGELGAEWAVDALNPARAAQDVVRNYDVGVRAADTATKEGGAEAVQAGLDVGEELGEFAIEEGPGIVEETARKNPEKVVAAPVAAGAVLAGPTLAGSGAARGVRSASGAGRRAASAARKAGTPNPSVPRVDRGVDVSVQKNADAPLVDVSDLEFSNPVSAGSQRLRQLPQRAELAGLRARRDVDEFLTDLSFEVEQRRAAVRDLPSNVDPVGSVRRAGQRVELSARRGRRRADDFAADVAFTASEAGARARRAPRAAFERGQIATSRLGREIRDFKADLSFEVEQRPFLADVETGRVDPLGVLPESRPGAPALGLREVPGSVRAAGARRLELVDDAAFEAGEQFGARLGDLDDAAFDAGKRVGQTARRVEDLPGRIDNAAFDAGEQFGARLGDVDDAAFDAGVRVGETTRRGQDLPSDLDAAAFATGKRVGEATRQLEDLPGRIDDAAFDAGEQFGSRLGELDSAAFDAGVRVGEATRADTSDLVPSPGDYSIKVGSARRADDPQVIDADEFADVGLEAAGPKFDDGFDDVGGASAGGSGAGGAEISSGTGSQLVATQKQRPGTGTDPLSRVDELPGETRGSKSIAPAPVNAPELNAEPAGSDLNVIDEALDSDMEARSPTFGEEVTAPSVDVDVGDDDILAAGFGIAGDTTGVGQGSGTGVIETPVENQRNPPTQKNPPVNVTVPRQKSGQKTRGRGRLVGRGGGGSGGRPRAPPVDLDFPDADPDRKRKKFEFFDREVISPVEENPLESIDEDLKNL